MNYHVEHIIFKENEIEIHAIGFIIDENEDTLTISLTKSYGEYLDTKIIKLDSIRDRQRISIQ